MVITAWRRAALFVMLVFVLVACVPMLLAQGRKVRERANAHSSKMVVANRLLNPIHKVPADPTRFAWDLKTDFNVAISRFRPEFPFNATDAPDESSSLPPPRRTTLSLVMATRNDGYGGPSSLARVDVTMRALDYFAGKYNISVEIVIVEWNPPDGNDGVASTLPVLPNIAVVRVITVPRWVHDAWAKPMVDHNIAHPPMFEFIAKNIGIRRARGDFVMGHALDTIITEPWWRDVAQGMLNRAEMMAGGPGLHRMMRVDSRVQLSGSEPVTEVEAKLGESVQVVWGCPNPRQMHGKPVTRGKAKEGVDFMLDFATECLKVKGWDFTMASGDFEMMRPSVWEKIHGYVERPTYGHFDSVLYYQVKAAKIPIIGLFRSSVDQSPYYIWHQGHASGGLKMRAEAFSKVVTPYEKYLTSPFWQRNTKEEWGMPDYHFVEVVWHNGKHVSGVVKQKSPQSKEKNGGWFSWF